MFNIIPACVGAVLISIAGIMFIFVETVPKDPRYDQEMQQMQQQQQHHQQQQQQQQQQEQYYPYGQGYAPTNPMAQQQGYAMAQQQQSMARQQQSMARQAFGYGAQQLMIAQKAKAYGGYGMGAYRKQSGYKQNGYAPQTGYGRYPDVNF